MTLTFATLRNANLERCARWHPGGIKDWSLSRWAIAACGELGEACNVIKKINRAADGITGNKETPAELDLMLAGEIADTVIYLDLLAARHGIDLEAAVRAKFNAVSERNDFPERL